MGPRVGCPPRIFSLAEHSSLSVGGDLCAALPNALSLCWSAARQATPHATASLCGICCLAAAPPGGALLNLPPPKGGGCAGVGRSPPARSFAATLTPHGVGRPGRREPSVVTAVFYWRRRKRPAKAKRAKRPASEARALLEAG